MPTSPLTIPPDELAAERDAFLVQFLADMSKAVGALDADLQHGNVLAARESVALLRVHLSLLGKRLAR